MTGLTRRWWSPTTTSPARSLSYAPLPSTVLRPISRLKKSARPGSIRSSSSSLSCGGAATQIGAQIFIDGWALVAPGKPRLAARLAEAAASVSHDGESVNAAKLLAAMEAEAFLSADIDHLLDVGLTVIPGNSLIAR